MGLLSFWGELQGIARKRKEIEQKARSKRDDIAHYGTIPETGHKLIDLLMDYYAAPASTRPLGHGRDVGGLLMHSLRVAHNSIRYAGSDRDDEIFFNKLVILSLAHDLGKLIAYRIYDKIILYNHDEIVRQLQRDDEYDQLPANARSDASARHGQLSLYVLREHINEQQAIEECGGEEGWTDVQVAITNFHATNEPDNELLNTVTMGDSQDALYNQQEKAEEVVDDYISAVRQAYSKNEIVFGAPSRKENAGERNGPTLRFYFSKYANKVVNDYLRRQGSAGMNFRRIFFCFDEAGYERQKKNVTINGRERELMTVKIPRFFD